MSTKYEYGIAWRRDVRVGRVSEAHREDMSKEEAEEWLRDWRDMAPEDAQDLFVMVLRPIGTWEVVGA